MSDIYPNQTGQIFAQNLGSIVDKFEAQQKEHQARARLDAAYGTIAEQLGFDKNYIKTTSLEQKQGLVQGKQMSATLEHLKNQALESKMRQDQAPAMMEHLQLQNAQLMNADAAAQYQRQQEFARGEWYQQLGDMAPSEQLPAPLSNDAYDARALPAGQQTPGIMQMLQAGGRTRYYPNASELHYLGAAMQPSGTQFDPTLTTRKVTMGDGSVIEVPVGQTSATGAHFMPQLVPKNTAIRDAGEGPKLSKDGKFFWSEAAQEWKPMHAANSLEDALGKIMGSDTAKPNTTKLPGGMLRFRRNAKGELEQY